MYFSQAKSAKIAGVSRGTIANRLADGKLSQSAEGIELSELMRVFDYITESDVERVIRPDSLSESNHKSPATPANYFEKRLEKSDADIEWMREQIAARDKQLSDKDSQLAEFQIRLDQREQFWTGQVSQLQNLLPAPEAPKRRRFLGIF